MKMTEKGTNCGQRFGLSPITRSNEEIGYTCCAKVCTFGCPEAFFFDLPEDIFSDRNLNSIHFLGTDEKDQF